eukprot:TRINITY_DN6875_c0_g2_i2.p1 TRINITY_DN6875_c0_g2~~TRINITY_DN6875_c0_g2_i2.p1  ORF type:complete len:325 (+),score=77.32 TRINITY_DN6875_c0_g2_i2:205-1179(+)
MDNNMCVKRRGKVFTDPDTSGQQQQKLSFIVEDLAQAKRHIKDLELTIKLNKNIIETLLGNDNYKIQLQKVMAISSEEVAMLRHRLKTTTKERDDYKARLLIESQLNLKYKEMKEDLEKTFANKIKDYVDQLDKKECVLQRYQYHFHEIVELAKTYAGFDENIKKFISTCSLIEKEGEKISTLFDKTHRLTKEITAKTQELERLKNELAEVSAIERLGKHRMELKRLEAFDKSSHLLKDTINRNKQLEQDKSDLTSENARLKKLVRKLNQKLKDIGDGTTDLKDGDSTSKNAGDNSFYKEKWLEDSIRLSQITPSACEAFFDDD